MVWRITLEQDTYETAYESFNWEQIPDDYNIAYDCLRKHDDPDRPALYQAYPNMERETYTFRELDNLTDRLAAGLESLGVERGDRVAVVIPQKAANPLTHLACWKMGAISIPLSVLFGNEALQYRLNDSGAKVVVADESIFTTVQAVRDDCPELEHIVTVDVEDVPADMTPFQRLDEIKSAGNEIAETDAETPAIVIYTSGSTGQPKGVLHTHGVWLGHCPAFYMYFERDVADSVFWTPADWAWIGALGDLVFPAWHHGRPIVGYPMDRFNETTTYELMEEFKITDMFLPPTAIRMMMDVEDPAQRYDLELKTICSGGEPLTPEIFDWAEEKLKGVSINELYGQTEANLLVCNCRNWFPSRAGSMGKPVPGHDIAIVDQETGEEKPVGEVGMIAVRRDDNPVLFEGYWNDAEKTEAVRVGEWHLTGDLGYVEEDGYFWFKARDDEVIITAGYRVGPGEVESVILKHSDVEQVGVVGIPDDIRGEIIKAFVQPARGVTGDDALREEIQVLVKDRLAKYEYPREIDFVEDLPQTTTGKIQRRPLRENDAN